ncbi:hypothetical protein WJX72_001015 [[Myrmecia] bisecta]|uniref:Uncharacterized protein n=1 Tax=[Myrmecia] bisecta TaxID=41462 RepID=A0AAW1PW01_9CHLO
MAELAEETAQLRSTTGAAVSLQQEATGALGSARAAAEKASTAAQRHQAAVAALTADNLVFLMRLKRCEAELSAAVRERDVLRLAVEEQRGPWLDDVRAGVEEKVGAALRRVEELEVQLEAAHAAHTAAAERAAEERAELEEFLQTSRHAEADLAARWGTAGSETKRLQAELLAAKAIASEAQQRAADLAAEHRVFMETIRSMRQECTESLLKEEAALGQLQRLKDQVTAAQDQIASLQDELEAKQEELSMQRSVNQEQAIDTGLRRPLV